MVSMAKLKLLVTTGDFSKFLARDVHYLLEELEKITDLTIWYTAGNIHDVLSQLDFTPDFILINEYGETFPRNFLD